MRVGRLRWALALVALGGAGLALWQSSIPGVAGVAGALAAVAAALLVGLEIRPILLPPSAGREPEPPPDALASFRASLAGSAVARERVIATLARLTRARADPSARPPGPDEVARLEKAPPAEFRAWVRREVERLEAET